MHVKSCFADSAQALVDITSPVADQHASIDANCVVHGRTAAARHKRKHSVVQGEGDVQRAGNTPWRGRTFNFSICIPPHRQAASRPTRKAHQARRNKRSENISKEPTRRASQLAHLQANQSKQLVVSRKAGGPDAGRAGGPRVST